MSSRYEDKTEFVECEFPVSISTGQRKAPETSDRSTFVIDRSMNGCQTTLKTCWRASGKETKAYPTICIPTNYANWGLPKQERHMEVNNGYDV